MEQVFLNQDYQIFVWIPLVLLTIKELKGNWRQVFDNELTVSDRSMLQRINIFFVMPLVVLLHEIGHALATIYVGGEVKELHFGIWWGYVVPMGNFTNLDHLIITVAGNLVQVLVGFGMLLLALVINQPAVVALLVYSGLYAVGGTIIIYALMSYAGYYGDWIQIYRNPATEVVFIIGIVHAVMVCFLLYLIYGSKPRLWFTRKTRPKWNKDFTKALQRVKDDPTGVNYLSLAWSYFFVGMYKLSNKCLEKVEDLNPDLMDRFYLSGCIYRNEGKTGEAISSFEQIAENKAVNNMQRGRAMMAIGHCLDDELRDLDGSNESVQRVGNVVETYDQAQALIPESGDPSFYKACLFNKVGLHKEAEIVLKELESKKWLDPTLPAAVLVELKVARSSQKQDE